MKSLSRGVSFTQRFDYSIRPTIADRVLTFLSQSPFTDPADRFEPSGEK